MFRCTCALPADDTVPSATPVYPGANLQEREVYDLYGITFDGHPNLRRILLWDGFEGHPMRKDWHEAYYEGDAKPFRSRHPKGEYAFHEDKLALGEEHDLSGRLGPGLMAGAGGLRACEPGAPA